MSHRNARLTVHGRRLLVDRVRRQGMPVAHVARAVGCVSPQCAHRWVAASSIKKVTRACASGRRGRIACRTAPWSVDDGPILSM